MWPASDMYRHSAGERDSHARTPESRRLCEEARSAPTCRTADSTGSTGPACHRRPWESMQRGMLPLSSLRPFLAVGKTQHIAFLCNVDFIITFVNIYKDFFS